MSVQFFVKLLSIVLILFTLFGCGGSSTPEVAESLITKEDRTSPTSASASTIDPLSMFKSGLGVEGSSSNKSLGIVDGNIKEEILYRESLLYRLALEQSLRINHHNFESHEGVLVAEELRVDYRLIDIRKFYPDYDAVFEIVLREGNQTLSAVLRVSFTKDEFSTWQPSEIHLGTIEGVSEVVEEGDSALVLTHDIISKSDYESVHSGIQTFKSYSKIHTGAQLETPQTSQYGNKKYTNFFTQSRSLVEKYSKEMMTRHPISNSGVPFSDRLNSIASRNLVRLGVVFRNDFGSHTLSLDANKFFFDRAPHFNMDFQEMILDAKGKADLSKAATSARRKHLQIFMTVNPKGGYDFHPMLRENKKTWTKLKVISQITNPDDLARELQKVAESLRLKIDRYSFPKLAEKTNLKEVGFKFRKGDSKLFLNFVRSSWHHVDEHAIITTNFLKQKAFLKLNPNPKVKPSKYMPFDRVLTDADDLAEYYLPTDTKAYPRHMTLTQKIWNINQKVVTEAATRAERLKSFLKRVDNQILTAKFARKAIKSGVKSGTKGAVAGGAVGSSGGPLLSLAGAVLVGAAQFVKGITIDVSIMVSDDLIFGDSKDCVRRLQFIDGTAAHFYYRSILWTADFVAPTEDMEYACRLVIGGALSNIPAEILAYGKYNHISGYDSITDILSGDLEVSRLELKVNLHQHVELSTNDKIKWSLHPVVYELEDGYAIMTEEVSPSIKDGSVKVKNLVEESIEVAFNSDRTYLLRLQAKDLPTQEFFIQRLDGLSTLKTEVVYPMDYKKPEVVQEKPVEDLVMDGSEVPLNFEDGGIIPEAPKSHIQKYTVEVDDDLLDATLHTLQYSHLINNRASKLEVGGRLSDYYQMDSFVELKFPSYVNLWIEADGKFSTRGIRAERIRYRDGKSFVKRLSPQVLTFGDSFWKKGDTKRPSGVVGKNQILISFELRSLQLRDRFELTLDIIPRGAEMVKTFSQWAIDASNNKATVELPGMRTESRDDSRFLNRGIRLNPQGYQSMANYMPVAFSADQKLDLPDLTKDAPKPLVFDKAEMDIDPDSYYSSISYRRSRNRFEGQISAKLFDVMTYGQSEKVKFRTKVREYDDRRSGRYLDDRALASVQVEADGPFEIFEVETDSSGFSHRSSFRVYEQGDSIETKYSDIKVLGENQKVLQLYTGSYKVGGRFELEFRIRPLGAKNIKIYYHFAPDEDDGYSRNEIPRNISSNYFSGASPGFKWRVGRNLTGWKSLVSEFQVKNPPKY